MMSLTAIKEQNREAAAIAAAEGRTPFVFFEREEVRDTFPLPFPFLGDHRPEGWELIDEHFADSSGLGAADEPALSMGQLLNLIEEKIDEAHENGQQVGWAIIEAGQFQVYVGEFRRSRS